MWRSRTCTFDSRRLIAYLETSTLCIRTLKRCTDRGPVTSLRKPRISSKNRRIVRTSIYVHRIPLVTPVVLGISALEVDSEMSVEIDFDCKSRESADFAYIKIVKPSCSKWWSFESTLLTPRRLIRIIEKQSVKL